MRNRSIYLLAPEVDAFPFEDVLHITDLSSVSLKKPLYGVERIGWFEKIFIGKVLHFCFFFK